jgi:NAD(P)H-hydrate repair Nnr-like enzyme with NAD(P)H-hydrate dehydratase domain
VVLTPHEGELRMLTGRTPGPDRIAEARELAGRLGTVVLLKGRTTVVADASGAVRLVTSGDQRLATAGTGDVLSGVIGALLAAGVPPLDAAALGAHVRGPASSPGTCPTWCPAWSPTSPLSIRVLCCIRSAA